MNTSKKIVLSADGTSATVTDATAMDVVTTMVSFDTAITGPLGAAQKLGFAALGAIGQTKRLTGSWNPIPGRA